MFRSGFEANNEQCYGWSDLLQPGNNDEREDYACRNKTRVVEDVQRAEAGCHLETGRAPIECSKECSHRRVGSSGEHIRSVHILNV